MSDDSWRYMAFPISESVSSPLIIRACCLDVGVMSENLHQAQICICTSRHFWPEGQHVFCLNQNHLSQKHGLAPWPLDIATSHKDHVYVRGEKDTHVISKP